MSTQPDIRLNDPRDGAWIMAQVGGAFSPEIDSCIARHRGASTVGGFAFYRHTGASCVVAMAGADERWCSRDLLWMAFDYPFRQLGYRRIFAEIRTSNHLSLSTSLRAGWRLEATIREVFPDGAGMIILAMSRDECRYLKKLRPQAWVSNQEAA